MEEIVKEGVIEIGSTLGKVELKIGHVSKYVHVNQNGATHLYTQKETKQVAYKLLELLGISITDLQRQAFEAGRLCKHHNECTKEEVDLALGQGKYIYKYDSFDDYQNREK